MFLKTKIKNEIATLKKQIEQIDKKIKEIIEQNKYLSEGAIGFLITQIEPLEKEKKNLLNKICELEKELVRANSCIYKIY